MKKKVALVTGGNRGIGQEVCRQLLEKGCTVILTARDKEKGKKTASALGCDFIQMDVTDPASVTTCARETEKVYGRLDVLINNAGLYLDQSDRLIALDEKLFSQTFGVNLFGPLRVIQAFLPLMKKGGYGRIVNVSSGLGQQSNMGAGTGAYKISKLALNGLTRVISAEVDGKRIKVNAVCPGWVRTAMGGPGAPRSVKEGASGIVWAATLPESGPTGGFFRDGKPIDW